MAAPATRLNPVVQLGICVGGIYVSFLVWALVCISYSRLLRETTS